MSIPQVNFKLLHIFIAVAEHSSFRQAADQLNRSQSAVSMQIKQLEEQVGVPLFHRTTRRVELTAEGEELMISARRAISEWDAGLRSIREAADVKRGRISVGCVPSIAVNKLPSIVRQFTAAHENIEISLQEAVALSMFESIRRREIDFGIAPSVEKFSEFHFEPLVEERICAVGLPHFFPPRAKCLRLEDLNPGVMIKPTFAAALTTELEERLRQHELYFSSNVTVLNFQTMVAFAREGIGVAVLPEVSVSHADKDTLLALPIVDPVLTRTLCIVTLRGQALSPAAQSFCDIARTQLRGDIPAMRSPRKPTSRPV